MTPSPLSAIAAHSSAIATDEKILEIDHVTVSFDGFLALNDLNFSLAPGELRVIIGPNGAGKTTFLDTITGKVQPTQGTIRFKGRNLRGLPEHKISRLGIGRKFQTPRVYLNLTVRENLELSCFPHKGVLSSLFSPRTPAERRTVPALLETVGLTSRAELPAALLSHGEKQRLEIGMLVAQSPDLLLVDEPAAGLTDEETYALGELLQSLAESHALVVIEHDMEFVRQIARQVTVLHQGSVLFEGSMDDVQSDPRVIEVYLGNAPSITEEQMRVLRVVAAVAWCGGALEPAEEAIALERLSGLFATDSLQKDELKKELQDYLRIDDSLETAIAALGDRDLREQVLALSYEVVRGSDPRDRDASLNEREAYTYGRLIEMLSLPPEVVQRIEGEVEARIAP